jgi:beta-alanine--pyruvate transaminase
VFFVNSGSEGVDTALKIALAYHRVKGEGARTRLIGRERGYHGVGFGGISVGGMVNNRKTFGAMLPASITCRTPTTSKKQRLLEGPARMGRELADDLERLVACMTHPPSPRSSSSPWPVRPACCCRRRATCSACARSATSTASC